MLSKNKPLEFLDNIKKEMTKETIEIIYNVENIKYEKCELYKDFIQSLVMIMFDTYLGDDITNENDRINHFNWCWEQNIKNFKKEKINIKSNQLYGYFLDFMNQTFYSSSDKNEKNMLKMWKYLFDFNANKNKSDIDMMIVIYKMFENSLKII